MKSTRINRFLAIVLSLAMVIVMLPSSAFSAVTTTASDATSTNVAKVQSYAAQLRDDNTAGKTTGKYTWDTEGKGYSWAYFNGLMLDALNMIGGDKNTSFTDAFYNANIDSDGSIVNFTSSTSASTGALDSVEPIRAVFDVLSTSSNADKYKKGIQTIYTMLENQITYSDCGGNFAHKQDNSTTVSSSWSSYPIALDGIYMAEPFLMECANAIDAGTLTLTDKKGNTVSSSDIYKAVYDRLVWIYNNLYDSSTGLYNHAYNPSTGKTNGIAWTRSIGWYSMALVDIIDMMPDKTMKADLESELTQIFDGMLAYQDSETGLWYNVTAYDSSLDKNKLETSGTSMMAYAMMKAYNNGWVTDTKYAEAGLNAFNGVVANKMSGSENSYSVADTYKSSGAGTTASYYTTSSYTTNEAKGVAPLIMASTLANATAAALNPVTEDAEDTDSNSASAPAKAAAASASAVTASGYLAETETSETYTEAATLSSSNYSNYKTGYYYSTGSGYKSITGISYKSRKYTLTFSDGTQTSNLSSVKVYSKTTKTVYSEGDAVTLSVTPSSATLNAYNKQYTQLTAAVTVGDSAAAATTSKITWSSDNTAAATVDQNGVVTSVAAGTANITATLTEVNGFAIYKNSSSTGSVVVTIPITVTYEEKKSPIQDYTYDSSLKEATTYAEYPADGAVRIAKTATGCDFATTGVANVELDAAGISVKTGVDVVLVLDVSNSMAWNVDKLNDGKTGTDACPDSGQNSKLDDAVDSMTSFTNILLGGNTGSAQSDNTVSLVTFGGYDKQNTAQTTSYFDSVQTVFSSYSVAKDAIDVYDTMSLKYNSSSSTSYTLSINGTSGANYGNTCYDYAFYQAYDAITTLQSAYKTSTGTDYAESGRETYVLFMTDGAPSNYEYKYYKNNSSDYYPGTTTKYTLQGSSSPCSADNWYSFISTTPNTLAEKVYDKVNGNLTVIGFDLDHGGFNSYSWTGEKLPNFLKQMVDGETLTVMSADDSATLKSYYESFASKMKYAGTKAQVTDTIKSSYTLQTTPFTVTDTSTDPATTTTVNPDITVTSYDLYTKTDTTDTSKIGTRKGTSSVLETVTFNAAGTEAYSSVLGSDNIMTTSGDTVKIDAYYFTYTKSSDGTEKFVWKIGSITEKEIALNYYVYLKGALEGDAEKGIYDTNEKAVLDYIDINGDKAQKTFPVPALAWGGASTAYEFYLVNASGQPVNHAGEVVPFANRVIVAGPTYKTLNINQSAKVEAETVKASEVLPEGYYLYDENAYYTVSTSGGNSTSGSLTVSDPSSDASATKGGQTQTGAQTTKVVSFDEKNYTQSVVAFGIRYDMTPTYVDNAMTRDQIVIDYGKSIDEDVLANDLSVITSNSGSTKYDGYTRTLVGFAAYNASANLKQVQKTAGSETYTTDNGSYQIVNQKVRFTPSRMMSDVDKVFCVVKFATTTDAIYLYEELDVIPANSIYYEDEFPSITWTDSSDVTWETVETASTDLQSDGTVGSDAPYGYDSVYNDDTTYSNGSAHKAVVGSGKSSPSATFTFTGTGFDLISNTGAQQGVVDLTIYNGDSAEGTVYRKVSVQNTGENELYQIPVASVTGIPYGTYTVVVEPDAAFTSTKYPALNRGGEHIFDAVRIYHPADENDSIVSAAYTTDNEANAVEMELRNAIIDAASFDAEGGDGIIFVDGNGTTTNDADVATYTSVGPNNEVYLKANQTVAFNLQTTAKPESVQIGAKSPDGKSVTLNVTANGTQVATNASKANSTDTVLSQATAQNYSLSLANVKYTENSDGTYKVTLCITNKGTDDGILSLTNLKVTFAAKAEAAFVYDADTVTFAKAAAAAEGETVPEIKTVAVSGRASLILGAKLTVTTTEELGDDYSFAVQMGSRTYTVNATNSMKKLTVYKASANSDGTYTYTLSFRPNSIGSKTFAVYILDSDGNYCSTSSVTAKVQLF